MKKIIIIAISILCVVASLIFMAQTCDQAAGTEYVSYIGDWYSTWDEGDGDQGKIELSLQEGSWQVDIYTISDSTETYQQGARGTLSVNGDEFTMTVNELRAYIEYSITDWYGITDEGGYPFLYLFSYMIHLGYIYAYYLPEYFYEDLSYYYVDQEKNPSIEGWWATTSSGNRLILYMDKWGADAWTYITEGLELPKEGMVFDKS